jgi:hypothetical protein
MPDARCPLPTAGLTVLGLPVRRPGAASKTEQFTANEFADDDKQPLLPGNLKDCAWEAGALCQGVGADAPDEDLSTIAPLHPVFRISRRPLTRARSERRLDRGSEPAMPLSPRAAKDEQ